MTVIFIAITWNLNKFCEQVGVIYNSIESVVPFNIDCKKLLTWLGHECKGKYIETCSSYVASVLTLTYDHELAKQGVILKSA